MTTTCVGCYMPTNLQVAVAGSREWLLAALLKLDLPENEALVTLDLVLKESKKKPPALLPMAVCRRCGAKVGIEPQVQSKVLVYIEPGMRLTRNGDVIPEPWVPPGAGKSET